MRLVSIYGHSLGGYITLQVAIENKDLIEKKKQIEPKGFKLIRDIPCLILWVKMIDLYHLIATPLTFCITFLMRDLR